MYARLLIHPPPLSNHCCVNISIQVVVAARGDVDAALLSLTAISSLSTPNTSSSSSSSLPVAMATAIATPVVASPSTNVASKSSKRIDPSFIAGSVIEFDGSSTASLEQKGNISRAWAALPAAPAEPIVPYQIVSTSSVTLATPVNEPDPLPPAGSIASFLAPVDHGWFVYRAPFDLAGGELPVTPELSLIQSSDASAAPTVRIDPLTAASNAASSNDTKGSNKTAKTSTSSSTIIVGKDKPKFASGLNPLPYNAPRQWDKEGYNPVVETDANDEDDEDEVPRHGAQGQLGVAAFPTLPSKAAPKVAIATPVIAKATPIAAPAHSQIEGKRTTTTTTPITSTSGNMTGQWAANATAHLDANFPSMPTPSVTSASGAPAAASRGGKRASGAPIGAAATRGGRGGATRGGGGGGGSGVGSGGSGPIGVPGLVSGGRGGWGGARVDDSATTSAARAGVTGAEASRRSPVASATSLLATSTTSNTTSTPQFDPIVGEVESKDGTRKGWTQLAHRHADLLQSMFMLDRDVITAGNLIDTNAQPIPSYGLLNVICL
jgi:hypothetical protein